jgi:hypothetical protein
MSIRPIPNAQPSYNESDERIMRRQVEQNFRDLDLEIRGAKSKADKESSLAMRRYQFLLMGASHV